jgi:hypothetical protein
MDPRMLQNTQQMMAQKLMDMGPAPTANSSAGERHRQHAEPGARGAMMPSMMETARTGQTPDWMKWIGNIRSATPSTASASYRRGRSAGSTKGQRHMALSTLGTDPDYASLLGQRNRDPRLLMAQKLMDVEKLPHQQQHAARSGPTC